MQDRGRGEEEAALDWETLAALERQAVFEAAGRDPDRAAGRAFSGGGIRSATFNLGVIQALAELKLLREFDYLSCVSGGGYIGGWLSAFIHRRCEGRVEAAEEALRTGGDENPAIRFLRGYSNYLTPRASLLSADTLTAVATWLRNLYLNLVLLLLALGAAMLLPRLLVRAYETLAGLGPVTAARALFGGGAAALVVAVWFIGRNLGGRAAWSERPFYTRQAGVVSLVVLPLLVSAWLITCGFYVDARGLHDWSAANGIGRAHWAVLGALLYALPGGLGWLRGRRGERQPLDPGRTAWMALYALLAGALGGVLLSLIADLGYRLVDLGFSGPWATTALGTALMLKFYSLTVASHIGLTGRYFSHEVREWWARLGGWLLLAALVWLAGFVIVYLAPAFFRWAPDAFVAAGGFAWLGSTAAGVLFGRSAAGAGDSWRHRLAPALPYVFVVGLLGLLAWGLHALLARPALCPACVDFGRGAGLSLYQIQMQEAWNFRMTPASRLLSLLAGALLLLVFLGRRFDVNL